jgi:FkbM family methyltransferase
MQPTRLSLAQAICRHLPPFLSQRARAWLYPQALAHADNYTFVTNSQTGSRFTSTTADIHGYPFAVYGYSNWRAWAIALAVCKPGDTIIEVGANVGTETVGFADIVGCEGRVVAFEPLPSNLEALERVRALQHCQNIALFPMALSDKNTRLPFSVPATQQASGTGRLLSDSEAHGVNTLEVECRTLDSMQAELGAAAFVFMDTEGAEYSILRGGQAWFGTHQPVLVLEAGANQLKKQGLTLQALYDEVTRLGYAVFDIARFGLSPVTPGSFKTSATNWLCLPTTRAADLLPRLRRSLTLCGWMPCVPLLNPMTRKATQR